MKSRLIYIFSFLILLSNFCEVKSQEYIDYETPREYEIGGITVNGLREYDEKAVLMFSGLSVGDMVRIPGDRISDAIKKLWDQGLFSDVSIDVVKTSKNIAFINIDVKERPRLSRLRIRGVKKSETSNLKDEILLTRGKTLTQNAKARAERIARGYFIEKGFYNVEVIVSETPDTLINNSVYLDLDIKKGNKMKINDIRFSGNTVLSEGKLRRSMKGTKKRSILRLFSPSKFIQSKYKEDKKKIIAKYNESGYRDARIVEDTVYQHDDKTFNIEIKIDEGNKFYFRNIRWIGNSKYSNKQLSDRLGIKKGDVFNQALLDERLHMSENSSDISSLYMDDGYLFFQVNPIEARVENDSIDFEMHIYEGKQARINKVTLKGNTKTNDHVVLREIRTYPGDLFSRSDIIRTQRELSQLGYFNPETLGVEPKPDPQEGTVDIEYTVEERPSDQIELSGGFGAGMIIGTLGIVFNNFSTKNFFKKDAWRPLPAGDGQQLSLRAQSSGLWFQSYNASFTEPWLGGKKPNSLTVSAYQSIMSNGQPRRIDDPQTGERIPNPNRNSITITGVTVGLGKRLKKPDDFFVLRQELGYQHYKLDNYQGFFTFDDGQSNVITYGATISRNSISQPIYPRWGSNVLLSVKATPPFSQFDDKENYGEMPASERYQWVEYHKWKFTSQWFTTLIGGKGEGQDKRDLVLNTRIGFGFIGRYNPQLASPFERFYLGGSGLTGFNIDGREIIALRGYDDQSITPRTADGRMVGGNLISKYTLELRYPISLNPQATVFVLGFLEGGNNWLEFRDFNPFEVKRSAGFGLRIFLPMFGLMGIDYGWGFDSLGPGSTHVPGQGQFHFTIGMNLGEL